MDNDDRTGLRQLSNKDLVVYAVGRDKLSQLELELVLRLEQVVEQRIEVMEKLPSLPCSKCPAFPNLMPSGAEDATVEITGDTQWA